MTCRHRCRSVILFVGLACAWLGACPSALAAAPFAFRYQMPVDGQVTLVLEDAAGNRLANLVAQREQAAGEAEWRWDLRDGTGAYVAPGRYRLRGIAGPPLGLSYRLTPYPNVDQQWPDRTPWMQGHASPHGWLSDHSSNQAIATCGDRLYLGASMAEAGVCFIECDLEGRKLWGKNNFGAWLGVYLLAAEPANVYVASTGKVVYRFDPETRQSVRLFQWGTQAERQGALAGFAAGNGQIFLSFTGSGALEGGVRAAVVDLEHCLPKPVGDDFLRALRLHGKPPGQVARARDGKPMGNGQLDLESTLGRGRQQHILIAFREPTALGSLLFPYAHNDLPVSFSVLAETAPWPPKLNDDQSWVPFEAAGEAAWNCWAAPPGTRTRALRITFTRADRDELDAMLDDEAARGDTKAPGRSGLDDLLGDDGQAAGQVLALSGGQPWFGRLEGLRFLRRRYANLFPSATVRVNSGRVDADGVWDAQRADAIAEEKPGIYVMQWAAPQKIAGLAIKEIDGARTEIDVWLGAGPANLPLDGEALDRRSPQPGWHQVATYRQERRSAYHPSPDCNRHANYIDGVVDFREEIETRGVRLRIVEQWLDHGNRNGECRRHDGRSEHGMHYTESYAARLDTRICRVEGVAVLSPLGGELPVDALAHERLEVRDGQTGVLVHEWPLRLGWHSLATGPGGKLFAIDKAHRHVLAVDPEAGTARVVVPECAPSRFAVGPDGAIFVQSWENNGTDPIKVYAADGKLLRTVGQPGGHRPGRWDGRQLEQVAGMAVDRAGSLWLIEGGNYPRRTVQFRADGSLGRELLGNTFYGGTGGGALHRYDPTRAWYGRVEFELDWQQNRSRIRSLLAESLEGADLVAVRLPGRPQTYLVTVPHSLHPRQSHGAVYLYDQEQGTVRLVAAMGDATYFQPLRQSAVISKLGGAVPKAYTFVWSDLNGDGQVDAAEVEFTAKAEARHAAGVGRFDPELGCLGPGVRYEVKEFLADGVPVYRRTPVAGSPHLRFASGADFTLSGSWPGQEGEVNLATAADGRLLWSYPASAGVSGLYIPHWRPGQVTNQFAIVGHEIAPAGELGEFIVVHANTGEWNVWTADGLLAAQILLHKGNPKAKLLGPATVRPGDLLAPLSASQEHFHGFFTRSEVDQRYYIVAGFTHMSIIEVEGLEQYRRLAVEAEVTAEDLRQARAWGEQQSRLQVQTRSLLAEAVPVGQPPIIDGDAAPHEWTRPVILADDAATFAMSYDDQFLYLCWKGRGLGPLRNVGDEWQRLFKTGAALDFMLGTDAQADPARRQPVAGDLRLLVAFVAGQPQVVLYQPVAPGAKPEEAWSTRTEAAGETRFDRVVRLPAAKVAMQGDKDFAVEVAVPLAELGWRPEPGTELSMDWGVLTSADGFQVRQRLYWANQMATGTADEAVEARLEPHLWGRLRLPATTIEDLLEPAPRPALDELLPTGRRR